MKWRPCSLVAFGLCSLPTYGFGQDSVSNFEGKDDIAATSLHQLEGIVASDVSTDTSYVVKGTRVDDRGQSHTRMLQYYQGLPVFGGEATVHLNEDLTLYHLTDSLQYGLDLDTEPVLEPSDAIEFAVNTASSETDVLSPLDDLPVLG